MFQFIKEKLQKIYTSVGQQLHSIFQKSSIDPTTIEQIEQLLIKADTGTKTTQKIIDSIKASYRKNKELAGTQVQVIIEQELAELITTKPQATQPQIFLLVGINGSGKTTFAGKLAHFFIKQNQTCLIVAADTFRAAAPEQLAAWANRCGASILKGKPNQDPASVTFDGCEKFKKEHFDKLIIDTAGRLQTKENLLKELDKIKRIITKQLPNHQICTLLTIDAMLGQNSLEQTKIFHEVAKLDGIVLTKMDGTAKGGIIFSITQELGLPILYISWGEQMDDMSNFDGQSYIQNLLGTPQYQSSKNL